MSKAVRFMSTESNYIQLRDTHTDGVVMCSIVIKLLD